MYGIIKGIVPHCRVLYNEFEQYWTHGGLHGIQGDAVIINNSYIAGSVACTQAKAKVRKGR